MPLEIFVDFLSYLFKKKKLNFKKTSVYSLNCINLVFILNLPKRSYQQICIMLNTGRCFRINLSPQLLSCDSVAINDPSFKTRETMNTEMSRVAKIVSFL